MKKEFLIVSFLLAALCTQSLHSLPASLYFAAGFYSVCFPPLSFVDFASAWRLLRLAMLRMCCGCREAEPALTVRVIVEAVCPAQQRVQLFVAPAS